MAFVPPFFRAGFGKAKAWYSKILGITPYFDQPFYVGFNVGGYELGLDPDPSSKSEGAGGVNGLLGRRRR